MKADAPRFEPGLYRNYMIDGNVILYADPRHPEYQRYQAFREQEREYWSRPENNRRSRRAPLPELEMRDLFLGPVFWDPFALEGQSIPPYDERHPQHEEWRIWRQDVSMDSVADSVRRDFLVKQRLLRNEDLKYLLQLATKRSKEMQPKPTVESESSLTRFLRRVKFW